jgi:glycogen operon protein
MATLLIEFNSWQDLVQFKLPEAPGGNGWTLLMDTNMAAAPEGAPHFGIGHEYGVTGRSMLLFQLA